MANFHLTVSADSIAEQVATLLNTHNLLAATHSKTSLANSAADYLVEIYGDMVVGCIAKQAEDPLCTRLKHLCVHPAYRKRGIANMLLQKAMAGCSTPYVFATIREGNNPSLALVTKMGFSYVKTYPSGDHNIIMVGRRR